MGFPGGSDGGMEMTTKTDKYAEKYLPNKGTR